MEPGDGANLCNGITLGRELMKLVVHKNLGNKYIHKLGLKPAKLGHRPEHSCCQLLSTLVANFSAFLLPNIKHSYLPKTRHCYLPVTRYVDGLATREPEHPQYYNTLATRLVTNGYHRLPQGYEHLKKK